MKPHARLAGWLLLSSLATPFGAAEALASSPAGTPGFSPAIQTPDAVLLARGGGGGGGGGRGGGGRGGGGGGRGGGGSHRPQTGFQAAGGGLDRGSAKPSGGWSNRLSSEKARPSLDRPVAQRDGNRDGNRNGNRNVNRDINRDIDRNWTRKVNINDVNLYPGWARPGWGVARPWNYGWYGGWNTPTWGWWGARAAVWGVGALATAAIINDAVDDAVDDHVSYIVVPNSNYQLLYGTVSPTSSTSVSFDVTANGSTYRLTADCSAGTINGREPGSPADAELLNAACQVAYGST